jgi:hypothetical protein
VERLPKDGCHPLGLIREIVDRGRILDVGSVDPGDYAKHAVQEQDAIGGADFQMPAAVDE